VVVVDGMYTSIVVVKKWRVIDSDPCLKGSYMSKYVDDGYWQNNQLKEINVPPSPPPS